MARRVFWRDLGIYATVWTVLALFSLTQQAVDLRLDPAPVNWFAVTVSTLLNYYTCAIGTPVYIWFVRRFPIDAARAVPLVFVYLALMTACVVAKEAVNVPLQNALFHSGWSFSRELTRNFYGVFLDQVYFIVLLFAIEYYRSGREREMRTLELETELSQARLEALRLQLQPHFLFNTLNSIAALLRCDLPAAQEMLYRLGDMLRLTLDNDGSQEVPLRKELDVLELYLGIMRVRFGDRLLAQIEISTDVCDEMVPSFLLQPLVENAVRHGVEESSKTTNIRISATIDGGRLVLEVADNGCGLRHAAPLREGIGLTNTRRRLARLYGDDASLLLSDREHGGTAVTVRIPRRIGFVAPAGVPT
jgi:two-component system LytT family sensor kinase